MSTSTKSVIRAILAILGAWLLSFTVMLVAFHGSLPRDIAMPVFLFSASCVFPYDHFTLPADIKSVLTLTHWITSPMGFTLLGSRLPGRWQLPVALLSIPLLAFITSGALHLIGFP